MSSARPATTPTSNLRFAQRLSNAYHHAAHAAIHWIFGTEFDLPWIDMRKDRHCEGWASSREEKILSRIAAARTRKRDVRPGLKVAAEQEILGHLAGLAAENRRLDLAFHGNRSATWFSEVIADKERWLADSADIRLAFRLAKALTRDDLHAWQTLIRLANWARWAVQKPRVWAVIESTARYLLPFRTSAAPSAVRKSMAAAWGDDSRFRWWQLGPSWQRRFPAHKECFSSRRSRRAQILTHPFLETTNDSQTPYQVGGSGRVTTSEPTSHGDPRPCGCDARIIAK